MFTYVLVHTSLYKVCTSMYMENLFHMKTSYNAVHDGMYEYVLVRTSIRTVYTSMCLYVLVYTSMYWLVPVLAGMY